MSDPLASQPRRLTRGAVEQRGSVWWNRYKAEYVDQATGAIIRRTARMRLGEFRSAVQAAAELDRYLALLSADALQPGVAVTAREAFARFDRLRIALMRGQSRRSYRGIIRNHLEPALGHLPLSAIDANVAQELVVTLHQKGLARATVEAVRNRLLGILQHARAAGFAAHAIRRKTVKLPSEQNAERERRHITGEELTQILNGSSDERRVLWAVLGYAGLRIGEALGLAWDHVQLPAGVILVRQAATGGVIAPLKTRTARRDVPMLPELDAILTEYQGLQGPGARGLLFATRTGRARRSDDVRRRWLKPLLEELGLPLAGCHAFRHGLPGRLDALGLSPAAIQKFMGHATLAQTEHYLHRSTADLREQLDKALRRKATDQAVTP